MEIYSFRHIIAKEQRLKINVKIVKKLETKQQTSRKWKEENGRKYVIKIKTYIFEI